MYDRSYCATECTRKNCERNLAYHKPCTRFYSVSNFDEECTDTRHIRCKSFSPIGEDDYDEED